MIANQRNVSAGPAAMGRLTNAALSPELQEGIREMALEQLAQRVAALENWATNACVTQDSTGHLNFPASDKVVIENTSRIELRSHRVVVSAPGGAITLQAPGVGVQTASFFVGCDDGATIYLRSKLVCEYIDCDKLHCDETVQSSWAAGMGDTLEENYQDFVNSH